MTPTPDAMDEAVMTIEQLDIRDHLAQFAPFDTLPDALLDRVAGQVEVAHALTSAPLAASCSRTWIRPRRMWVLTVPRGMPVRAAISPAPEAVSCARS